MKKILLLAVVLAGGLVIYRRVQAEQAEEDLWIEATSAVEPEPVA
ncbi:MAG TPA: DLW-39 family protein [Acidothermaceae bacterium]